MRAKIKDLSDVSCLGDTVEFTVSLDKVYRDDVFNAVNEFMAKTKPFFINIEKEKKKRSANANGFCWTLCQKIAEAVGSTKETVYRKNIREVGSFDVVEVIKDGSERFIKRWEDNGIGWIAEKLQERNGYVTIIAYYGSSSYNTAEMARLIDSLVTECKTLGIETMSPNELKSLVNSWKKQQDK